MDINILEAGAEFESTDKKNVEENATGEAEIISGGFASEILGKSNDKFFDEILCAAGDVGAKRSFKPWKRSGRT